MDRLVINKNTPDVSDGIITRDGDGNPTGYFREGAMDLLKELTVFSVEQYKEGFLYDVQRKEFLESLGLKVLRFNDGDIERIFNRVCHCIEVETKARCTRLNLISE